MNTKIVEQFEALSRAIPHHDQPDIFAALVDLMLHRATLERGMLEEHARWAKAFKPHELAKIVDFMDNVAEAAEGFFDPLGDIYESLSSGGHKAHLGQFFTPEPIAQMMAGIIGGALTEDERPLRVADPAGCGSGRMILAAARLVAKNRWRHFFQGIDLDALCVKIATVNCWLNSIPAWLVRGDALQYEVLDGFEVRLSWYEDRWLPHVWRFTPDERERVSELQRFFVEKPSAATQINEARIAVLESQKKARTATTDPEPTPKPVTEQNAPPTAEKRATKRNAPPPNQTSLF